MKLLSRIEKNKMAWLLIGLCLIFFFLRLPSVIEPYWYGDEGIYEVIGQSMNHGRLLYRDIWDNKPPLLYVIYTVAGGDQPTVKIYSLIIGLGTILAFYFLSQALFKKQKISILLTTIFVLLFGTPILEANIANAEDFILLPIILGGLIIYNIATKQKKSNHFSLVTISLLAGLLLGIAFLLKIVAIFDLAAFLLFVIIINFQFSNYRFPFNFKNLKIEYRKSTANGKWQMINIQPLLLDSCFLILGFLIPFLITMVYFAFHHALADLFQSVFAGNISYVGYKNSLFGIPQGWLILKTLLLTSGILLIFIKRKRLSSSEIFILLWIIFAIFNVYFSGRPYTHYAIVLLPSFCLFIGLLFITNSLIKKITIFIAMLVLLFILNYQFSFNLARPFLYYQNVVQFLSDQKSTEAYQTFFDPKVPRDYTVANFITSHTTTADTVFVWGNNPEIYALSHKIPIGKYTVAYHIKQNNAFDETQQIINKKEPKYIIVLTESQPLPFVIPLYIMRYNIAGATIYERSI